MSKFVKVEVTINKACKFSTSPIKNKWINKNFMAPFYGWGSNVSRLEQPWRSRYSFYQPQKVESTLEPRSGFEHETLRLGIQHPSQTAVPASASLGMVNKRNLQRLILWTILINWLKKQINKNHLHSLAIEIGYMEY